MPAATGCGLDLTLADGAHVVATSQAAEKIYRAEHAPAVIDVRLALGDAARLDWLPQETILFNGGKVERRLDVAMQASSELTLLEILVLGRVARGERVEAGLWRDRWRIRRDGRLVFAEDVRLDGGIADMMQGRAIGGDARAIATLLHISPELQQRLDAARETLADARSDCGASAWNGMLVARFAAADPADVRADAGRLAMTVTGAGLPRSWNC